VNKPAPPSPTEWGLVSKILTTPVNIPEKNGPSQVGTSLRSLKINTVILKKVPPARTRPIQILPKRWQILPKLFQTSNLRNLSEFFRQSHAPPSLPDRHQRPHSLAQRLHDLRHVQVHRSRHLLLVPTRAKFRLILTCVYVNSIPNFSQKSQRKTSNEQFPIGCSIFR